MAQTTLLRPELDGINVNEVVTTASGDILLNSARDIRVTHAINSTDGHIGLMAPRNIIQDANGDITTGGDAFVEAGIDWRMHSDGVIAAMVENSSALQQQVI